MGPTGPTEPTGPAGNDGNDGADGNHGNDGEMGPTGPTGPNGDDGSNIREFRFFYEDGELVGEATLENGEVVPIENPELLLGPQGPTGPTGESGGGTSCLSNICNGDAGYSAYMLSTPNTGLGLSAMQVGIFTVASGEASFAEGFRTIARGFGSHAEGYDAVAIGDYSHAEGSHTNADGDYSHAEGAHTIAEGAYSHAEGTNTIANGDYSHAEGYFTNAYGAYSHAEGSHTIANGAYSHAEGSHTIANGAYSHAEGAYTHANGDFSHAEGDSTRASGAYTHSQNLGTEASGFAQTSIGRYNSYSGNPAVPIQTDDALIIGNGTEATPPSNAFRFTFDGQAYTDTGGNWNVGSADYAELFEWVDGNQDEEIRYGLFVTLASGKINIFSASDDYILGITSASPGYVGDSHGNNWHGKYITDKYGKIRMEWQEIEQSRHVFDEETNTMVEKNEKVQAYIPLINPDFDPNQKYVPRDERPEWVAVGLMGKLYVHDDGTCIAGGYCLPTAGGIATASEDGFPVLKRISDDLIKVYFSGSKRL